MRVGGDDDSPIAVVDVERGGVAQEKHPVAGGERAAGGHDLVLAQPSGAAHERVGVGVELGDAAATERGKDGVLVGFALGGLPPVGELGPHRLGRVVGHG